MDIKRRTTISLFASLVFSGVLSIGLCVGWFHKNNSIDIEQLTGSVLKKYFEAGDGSEESPFEIARPKQYENFVRLHYEMEGFATRGFYFQFGHVWKNADGSYRYFNDGDPITAPVFADYSDDGVLNTASFSYTLNMASIKSMPPIGSDALPFNAHLEGNGLTISNFTVVANGYADVGIFGYVGMDARVTNTYFRNFTIDTSDGVYPEILTDASGNTSVVSVGARNHQHEDENVYMGYLAGHIVDAQAFNNVYVNNCKLTGNRQLAKTINNYGYYGQAEIDGLGGATGVGSDYQFELDAEAFHSYLTGSYNLTKNNRLLLRDTEESGKATYDRDGNMTGGALDMDPLKLDSAISPTTFRLGGIATITSDAYQLNGNTPANSTAYPRNYSISTTGHRGYPLSYFDHYYDVVAKQGATNFVPSDSDGIIITNNSLEGIVADNTTDSNPTGSLTGSYFYFNDKASEARPVGWRYMNAHARQSTRDDRGTISFVIDRFTFNANAIGLNPGYRITSKRNEQGGTLYFDDVPYPLTVTTSYSDNAITVNVGAVSIPNVQYGTHKVSAVIYAGYVQTLLWGGDDRTAYFGFGSSVSNNVVQQADVSFVSYGGNTFHYSYVGRTRNTEITSETNSFVYVPVVYTESDHIDLPLLGLETTYDKAAGHPNAVGVSIEHPLKFEDKDVTFQNYNGRWYAKRVIYEEDTDAEPIDQFIGDAEQLVDSGFNSRNLDIVGGDVKFTNLNLGNNPIPLISIPSESSASAATVKKIADSDIGKTFYAPSMCPNSVVLYLKNTSNARDSRDDKLGSIEFTYATLEAMSDTLVRWFGINIANPVFKKGDKDTIAISNYGERSTGNLTYTYTLDSLLESDVKEISFCALDNQGRILGNFASNGDASVGFNNNNSDENLNKIATYVICIGCYSTGRDSTECWVTNVKFNYKAEAGYGGTFGSVGYRDTPDTIENTILNFYFELTTDNIQYSIIIYFDQETLSYHITALSTKAVTMRIYNYYPETYSLYISTNEDGSDETLYNSSSVTVVFGG